MQGGRKPSQWNMFVKKIYHEGHSSNSKYSFKQALTDASRRKGEMGHHNAAVSKKRGRKSRKHGKKQRGTRKKGWF